MMRKAELGHHRKSAAAIFLSNYTNVMETHDSVPAMAGAYAEQAVTIAREFNARLDYSENSLMELEAIVAQLALDLPPGGAPSDELTEMCKM